MVSTLVIAIAMLAIATVQFSTQVDRAFSSPPAFRVDINLATAGELAAIPGVGPSLAKTIVNHRDQHGRFESLSKLMAVPGIGTTTLKRLSIFLTPISTK